MSVTIRLKFSRLGPVKYLGHLDMLRYFQKAVVRAALDVKYSAGFNPHQLMAFAYPLGVSMETVGDYLDLELNTPMDPCMVKEALNNVMNEGIKIVDAALLSEKSANAMAAVEAASYRLTLDVKEDGIRRKATVKDHEKFVAALKEIMSREEILIPTEKAKKKKGGRNKSELSYKDIRPGILVAGVSDVPGEEGILDLMLLSGSKLNVKPVSVVEEIEKCIFGPEEERQEGCALVIAALRRIEIFGKDDADAFVPLIGLGTEK